MTSEAFIFVGNQLVAPFHLLARVMSRSNRTERVLKRHKRNQRHLRNAGQVTRFLWFGRCPNEIIRLGTWLHFPPSALPSPISVIIFINEAPSRLRDFRNGQMPRVPVDSSYAHDHTLPIIVI